MKNGKKIGLGIGIGGLLLTAAGAAMALFFGKKKNDVELIEGVDYADLDTADVESEPTEE